LWLLATKLVCSGNRVARSSEYNENPQILQYHHAASGLFCAGTTLEIKKVLFFMNTEFTPVLFRLT
jgi:hypothetical protein